jgi:hypothetical protein
MLIQTELTIIKDNIGVAIFTLFIRMSLVVSIFLALRSVLGWILQENGLVRELDTRTSPLPLWDSGHET